jgi:pyridoxamine 5'-phosphate oxidase
MDPLARVAAWIEEARAAGVYDPDAMALATADAGGAPSVRIVLCRGVDERGVRFFTNYESRKGRELGENARAAAVFHWAQLGRQLRIEGDVERVSAAESDAYFAARPRGHQLSARASPQSRTIGSLDEVRRRYREEDAASGGAPTVPRPEYWGGYRIVARAVEFWVQGADRLHERELFERVDGGGWSSRHLAP